MDFISLSMYKHLHEIKYGRHVVTEISHMSSSHPPPIDLWNDLSEWEKAPNGRLWRITWPASLGQRHWIVYITNEDNIYFVDITRSRQLIEQWTEIDGKSNNNVYYEDADEEIETSIVHRAIAMTMQKNSSYYMQFNAVAEDDISTILESIEPYTDWTYAWDAQFHTSSVTEWTDRIHKLRFD